MLASLLDLRSLSCDDFLDPPLETEERGELDSSYETIFRAGEEQSSRLVRKKRFFGEEKVISCHLCVHTTFTFHAHTIGI